MNARGNRLLVKSRSRYFNSARVLLVIISKFSFCHKIFNMKVKKRSHGPEVVDKVPASNPKKIKKSATSTEPAVPQATEPVQTTKALTTEKLKSNLKKKRQRGGRKSKLKKVALGNTALGTDVGGFTVIGDPKQFQTLNVNRILPDWLTQPTVISSDLKKDVVPVDQVLSDPLLLQNLEKNFIGYFFPVQQQVIPWILDAHNPKLYRPSDICVSAPTGSGKTLAYTLPLIQILKSSLYPCLRAIIVLPTEVLATQVHTVLEQYCRGTRLKAFLMTKKRTFGSETKSLIRHDPTGKPYCPYDIVVATPGRLVDHIEQTEGFDLRHLKLLVVDEADRTLDDLEGDWLLRLEMKFWSYFDTGEFVQPWKSLPLSIKYMPLHTQAFQKLLFSATLSENPETLEKLHLFQPKLFTAIVRTDAGDGTEKTSGLVAEISDGFVGKFTKPEELQESCVLCVKETKPLYMFHLVTTLKWKRVLCFTNTTEAAERLCFLLNSLGHITAKEISSNWRSQAKDYVMSNFSDGSVDIIVTTDQMARGVDFPTVDYVISYDVPRNAKTYVHRVGRTARAGRSGQAITLLSKEQLPLFNKIVKAAGSTDMKKLVVHRQELKLLESKFQEALGKLKTKVESTPAFAKTTASNQAKGGFKKQMAKPEKAY